jgi:hypothetical protein
MQMASLETNLKIIHEGLARNVAIVTPQAKEKARIAAFEYMQNRNHPELGVTKSKDYERTEAILAWLAKLDEVNKSMPELPEEEQASGVEFQEAASNGGGNG